MTTTVAQIIAHTQAQRALRIAHREAGGTVTRTPKRLGISPQLLSCFKAETNSLVRIGWSSRLSP